MTKRAKNLERWFDLCVGLIPASMVSLLAVLLGMAGIFGAVVGTAYRPGAASLDADSPLFLIGWLAVHLVGASLGTIALWYVFLRRATSFVGHPWPRLFGLLGLGIGISTAAYWLVLMVRTNFSRGGDIAAWLWALALIGPIIVASKYVVMLLHARGHEG